MFSSYLKSGVILFLTRWLNSLRHIIHIMSDMRKQKAVELQTINIIMINEIETYLQV